MSGPDLLWHEVYWPTPLESRALLVLLHRLAADNSRGTVVWESRGRDGRVRHLVGAERHHDAEVRQLITALVPGTTLSARPATRGAFDQAARLKVIGQELPLAIDRTPDATRSILAAIAAARRPDEELVLQVALGPGTPPSRVGVNPTDPTQSWFHQLAPRPATAEVISDMRRKRSELGFRISLRAAARAATEPRRREAPTWHVGSAANPAVAWHSSRLHPRDTDRAPGWCRARMAVSTPQRLRGARGSGVAD